MSDRMRAGTDKHGCRSYIMPVWLISTEADFVQCCSPKMVKIIDQPANRPFSPGRNILKCNILAYAIFNSLIFRSQSYD